MIFETLNFLRIQLENFLSAGVKSGEPMIVLSNPWSANEANSKSAYLNSISLVNVEEERSYRPQQQIIAGKKENTFYRKEPELHINLYILVSTYNKNYEDSLKFLSKVLAFFQYNNQFVEKVAGKPPEGFPKGCEKIFVELFSVPFEQQSQIWTSLSTGYVPSVVYKIRMLVIDTEPLKPVMERVVENIVVGSEVLDKPIPSHLAG